MNKLQARINARITRADSATKRLAWRLMATQPEQIAEGVWLVRGGVPPKTMNVFLIRDGDGVLAFDAGIRWMANGIGAAASSLGGLTRVILGHAHVDHRGSAPGLGVPVLCHPDEVRDAEGDGGMRYIRLEELDRVGRTALYKLMARFWDGGPVQISDTLSEGDGLAGFEVIHLPGHAPGLIGLWRKRDRLALVSDCFYTRDPQSGRSGPPRVPHRAFNQDTEGARASIRKLAALAPTTAWPGHADAVTGDVRFQLEHAAGTT